MKVFTFGRAVRLAMLGGAIYYVRKHGGLRATWEQLAEKVRPLTEQAKEKMSEAAQNVSQNLGRKGEQPQEAQIEPQPGDVGGYQSTTGIDTGVGGVGTGVGSGIPDFGDKGQKTGY